MHCSGPCDGGISQHQGHGSICSWTWFLWACPWEMDLLFVLTWWVFWACKTKDAWAWSMVKLPGWSMSPKNASLGTSELHLLPSTCNSSLSRVLWGLIRMINGQWAWLWVSAQESQSCLPPSQTLLLHVRGSGWVEGMSHKTSLQLVLSAH